MDRIICVVGPTASGKTKLAVQLAKAYDGSFAEIGGVSTSLGVEQNAVGLPTGTWSLETFTVEEYEALYQKIADGTLVVDADFNNLEQEYSNLTLNII